MELPAGCYLLGEPGEERADALERVFIARWTVVNAHMRAFAAATGRSRSPKHDDPQLADHPATADERAAFEASVAAQPRPAS